MQLHKVLGAFKLLLYYSTTKDCSNSCYCTVHSTFNRRTQTITRSAKNFLKVLQFNANGIRNKKDEIQLLIKNTQADVITLQ